MVAEPNRTELWEKCTAMAKPPRGKPFQKGQCANPGGRPKIAHSLQALAREHTPEAIEALVAALKVTATRVPAAVALLDRGYGRPIQTQNVRVIRGLADLSDEELLAIAADPTGDEEFEGAVH